LPPGENDGAQAYLSPPSFSLRETLERLADFAYLTAMVTLG